MYLNGILTCYLKNDCRKIIHLPHIHDTDCERVKQNAGLFMFCGILINNTKITEYDQIRINSFTEDFIAVCTLIVF